MGVSWSRDIIIDRLSGLFARAGLNKSKEHSELYDGVVSLIDEVFVTLGHSKGQMEGPQAADLREIAAKHDGTGFASSILGAFEHSVTAAEDFYEKNFHGIDWVAKASELGELELFELKEAAIDAFNGIEYAKQNLERAKKSAK